MIYQLSTNFTIINQAAGVIENQSTYAVAEYITAPAGVVPEINTGIRIMPGGKFRFACAKETQAFIRFTFIRDGDYARQVAIVDDVSSNGGNGNDSHGKCCCCCKHCHCHCDNDKPTPEPPKTGVDLIISDDPQPDKNVLWGDPSNTAESATGMVDGVDIVIDNIKDSPNQDSNIIWGDTNI